MEFEAKQIPEGINTTKEHPLKEFFILLSGVSAIFAAVFFILILMSDYLVQFIPLEKEQQWFSENSFSFITQEPIVEDETEINNYLLKLVQQLNPAPDHSSDFTIQLIESEVPNAFITPGGHIFVTTELLKLVNSENSLSMVIAHEMAHQIHRHPIRSMGRGIVIGMALMIFTGLDGDNWASEIIADSFNLGLLAYSREQEREADKTGLKLLVDHYGHATGSSYFFAQILQQEDNPLSTLGEYMSTHPDTLDRLNYLQQFETDQNAELTPLPDFIAAFVRAYSTDDAAEPEPLI